MFSQAVSWLLGHTSLALDELKGLTVNFALGGLERVVARAAR